MTQTQTAEETTTMDILRRLATAVVRVQFPETDEHGNPSIARFLIDNGRMPFISDDVKPWNYRGWMIPQIQLAEYHPSVPARYDYVARTIEAGRLLDEPIPRIDFVGERDPQTSAGYKMLKKCLDEVEYTSGSWNGIREFCEWLGYALGVTPERSKLSEKLQEFLYRNFNFEPILLHPTDYLGELLCETSHGKKNGFYPTPLCICELMTRIVGSRNGIDDRLATTMDPCVGTGRMLLVGSNHSLRLFGQDIDYLCVLITKINLAFYAPWHYIPTSFFPAEIPETIDESDFEVKSEPERQDSPILAATKQLETETLSLFEQMRIQKESRKRRKYSTEIDDQLKLF